MLAHGTVLLKNGVASDQLAAIAGDFTHAGLAPVEVAIMAFADKIVRDATTVTADDIQGLRDHDLSDTEIFDVAATAAVRCFFSKLNDALGAQPDTIFLELEEGLRQHLVIGRPIGDSEVEHPLTSATSKE
jgi:alkylhydroperoxidase family enzyme